MCRAVVLQHLEHQGPKYVLDGLKTPLGSRTAAQQLQALHTENLQLKACLKEEVQARQHLEKKHGELLELLRCVSGIVHVHWNTFSVLRLLQCRHTPSHTGSQQLAVGTLNCCSMLHSLANASCTLSAGVAGCWSCWHLGL